MFDSNYSRSHQKFFWADLLFLLGAALYAWLSFKGIILLSDNGAILDSDLQTYAQGMAGSQFPLQFAGDPVLEEPGSAGSIHNLQRWLAEQLLEGQNFGLALLKAGSIAIFVFYSAWYLLGRNLFHSPALAALLSICCGITIWVGWGTFWGVTHSDPVPRVFFAAILPLLLLLGIAGYNHAWLRPVTMLCCGLAMWIHGVSALNCGAMLFLAYALNPAPGQNIKAHFALMTVCAICFLTPVLVFLWPSLIQKASFKAEDMVVFHEMHALRWQADYSDFGRRLLHFFSPASPTFFLTICGAVSWLALYGKKNLPFYYFWKMTPGFVMALFGVALFCWLENRFAPDFGRLPMGHELVRGLRFLMPIAWLLIIGVCAAWSTKGLNRLALALAICAIALLNQDRQHLAVETALAEIVKLPAPEKALVDMREAHKIRELMREVEKMVPENEAIFCPEDQMPLRYLARRPLAHSFKDGYVFFYNKNLAKCSSWLAMEKILRSGPDGIARAWQETGAPWLLAREESAGKISGKQVFNLDGWILVRK